MNKLTREELIILASDNLVKVYTVKKDDVALIGEDAKPLEQVYTASAMITYLDSGIYCLLVVNKVTGCKNVICGIKESD